MLFCYRKFYLAFDYICSNVISGWGGSLIVFGLVWFFGSKKKSPETVGGRDSLPKTREEPCLFSVKNCMDLIEDRSFENDRSHSVACVVSCTAYGKLADQWNMNILAKFKPVQ